MNDNSKLSKNKGSSVASSKRISSVPESLQTPKAMCTDNGKEFINDKLSTWCCKCGIDVQTTTPYSPSQNGGAERSNRTLVELA